MQLDHILNKIYIREIRLCDFQYWRNPTIQLIIQLSLFIITDSNPVCRVNMHSDGFVGPNTCNIEPENMIFTCAVSFNGKEPQLTWLNDSLPISSTICEYQPNLINCSVTMKADPLFDGLIPVCHTRASNAIDYNCTTEAVKVNCKWIVVILFMQQIIECNCSICIQCSTNI